MLTVSIVTPNYNGAQLLTKNLPVVIDECSKYPFCREIIITDDVSTDGSIDVVNALNRQNNKNQLKIRVITNTIRQGFAGNANKGVQEAVGDVVVLLNTDILPKPNFLLSIMKHFEDPSVFAVGMMDLSIEKGKTIKRGRGIGEWKRGFYVHRRGEVDQTDTAWVNGGSGAFRRSAFLKLGGFSRLYSPFYWEDIDLSYRAVTRGYRIVFEPKSVVVHEHEKGSIKTQYTERQVRVIAYRNQFIFVWRNAIFTQILSHLFWLPYHFITTILHADREFVVGFLQFLKFLPCILKERITL